MKDKDKVKKAVKLSDDIINSFEPMSSNETVGEYIDKVNKVVDDTIDVSEEAESIRRNLRSWLIGDIEYRESDYFDEEHTFLFKPNNGRGFESKVNFDKGYWWTNESLNYKCTSIKCVKMDLDYYLNMMCHNRLGKFNMSLLLSSDEEKRKILKKSSEWNTKLLRATIAWYEAKDEEGMPSWSAFRLSIKMMETIKEFGEAAIYQLKRNRSALSDFNKFHEQYKKEQEGG